MSNTPEWLKVAVPAQIGDCEMDMSGIEEKLAKHSVGLASPTAWMSYMNGGVERDRIVLSVESLHSLYGFNSEDADYVRRYPNAKVTFWTPKTEEDFVTALNDLEYLDDENEYKEYILDGMRRHAGKPLNTIVAVRGPKSKKTEGILIYRRYLEFVDDVASVDYHVHAFHGERSPAVPAALLGAMHCQAIADLECAITSIKDAGISTKFNTYVFTDGEDRLEGSYYEMMDLAKQESFTHPANPWDDQFEFADNTDMTDWIIGNPDKIVKALPESAI